MFSSYSINMQESCGINCKQEAQVLFRLDGTVLSPIHPFSGPSNISSSIWTVTQSLRALKFRCVLYTYLHQSTKITGQRTTVTTVGDSLCVSGCCHSHVCARTTEQTAPCRRCHAVPSTPQSTASVLCTTFTNECCCTCW